MSTPKPKYPRALIDTNQGKITVELWNDVAPKHVENFLKLANQKFYDGLIFHRIIPGFVIQGGCPQGTGTGGPGWNVKAEFNDRQHVPGTLSMARSQHPDSAGSQFFICLTREKCQHLDKQYTAFGQVIDGMDVVNRIASTKLGRNDRPVTDQQMLSVTPLEDGPSSSV
ncbi:MAG TPA: peptidylprolyl isomerase [Phycisphaerales bacterium]|nr:peptidylprolyl isomerase [Phycisphaerales bacterium]